MDSSEKVFRLAVPSQLASAIDETPGLIVPVLVSFAVLESLPTANVFMGVIQPLSLHLLNACLASLIGVILYAAGDYWDKRVFDKRYGPGGTWIGKTPKWFPSASDLAKDRESAADRLPGVDPRTQEGAYAAAEYLLRDSGRWGEVEGPLVISKFVRSFIWPCVLATVMLASAALVALVRSRNGLAIEAGTAMLISASLAVVSFVPYCRFRVKHMRRLYRLAARIAEEEDAS